MNAIARVFATLVRLAAGISLVFAAVPPALAAPGAFDATFGTGGKVLLPAGTARSAQARAMAVQSNGQVLVAGQASTLGPSSVALVRFNANGSLDDQFGTGGRATFVAAGTSNVPLDLAIQADGKPVIALNNALVRLTVRGKLDTTFNGTGILPLPGLAVGGVAVQPDGKLVVVGASAGEFAVARRNADGSADTAFGSGGIAGLDVGDYPSDATRAIVLSNGKILVGGNTAINGGLFAIGVSAVARFNANGTVDTSFGTGGSTTVGGLFKGMALAPDGRIALAASYSAYDPNTGYQPYDIAVWRLAASGQPDATFAGTGYVFTDYSTASGSDYADALTVQPDGKIVATGHFDTALGSAVIALRFNLNGTRDTSFGGDGISTFTFASGFAVVDTAAGVAVLDDGRLIVAGTHKTAIGNDFGLARLTAGGALDGSFQRDGTFTVPAGNALAGITALAIQPDERVVAAGYALNGLRNDFALMRFGANGSADQTFNGGVPPTLSLGAGDSIAFGVGRQPDGKLVVAGYAVPDTATGLENFALARYKADGSIDTLFGSAGKVLTPMGSAGNGRAEAMAFTGDGGILLAGRARDGTKLNFALARYTSEGVLDPAFGNGGKVTTAIGAVEDRALALALQPDGRILAAGASIVGSAYRFAVARYLANGTLDAGFAAGAGKVTPLVGPNDAFAYAIALQGADGRILVGGSSDGKTAVIRLLADGTLDTSFASAGKFVQTGGAVRSILVEAAGTILLVTESFRIVRLTPSGQVDSGYGTAGATAVAFSVDGGAYAGALRTDGRLVVGGFGDDGQGESMALAQLESGDSSPDAFAFVPQAPVPRSTAVTSNAVTVSGIDVPVAVTVANGSYSIGCNGTFVTTPGVLASGQSVCVRHTSAAGFAQPVTTTLAVGAAVATFTSTTVTQASVTLSPSSLAFGLQDVGTASAPQGVTIANGGEDAVNGLLLGTLGDFVVASTTCGSSLAGGASCAASLVFLPLATGPRIGELAVIVPGAVNPQLAIALSGSGTGGGVTPGGDTTPDAFQFVDQFAVPVSTPITSAPVPITGIASSALATVIGGEWCASTANGCACDARPFSREPGTVSNGQFVCVRHVSSPVAGNSTDTQFVVGGVGDTFTSTTIDIVPAPFAFVPVTGVPPSSQAMSAAAVISGINAPSPVSVTGGEYSVGCTGAWTSTAGTVANGQSVCVRHVAAGGYSATTSTTLTIGGVTGSFVSTTASATTIPRLGNISTRMQVLTGNDVLIGGFIIGGTQPKTVVVRARGPSLAAFGIADFLANPKLDLYSGQSVIASNDDWGTAGNAAAVLSSGFAPENAQEAAVLVTLSPGAYTAVVSGSGGGTGVGIVEVFEVDLPEVPLANISTRGQVLTGNDVMIGGFVIQGSAPQTVIVRARGPSLAGFGIANFLANPVLQLFSGQAVIAANDNWQTDANSAQVQSRGFAPASPLESAILVTLNPGAYTAIVTGAGGTTGVGIIEVFAQ